MIRTRLFVVVGALLAPLAVTVPAHASIGFSPLPTVKKVVGSHVAQVSPLGRVFKLDCSDR